MGGTDAWLLCPFFLQGGRYTIGDVHYVADGGRWVGGKCLRVAKYLFRIHVPRLGAGWCQLARRSLQRMMRSDTRAQT